MGYFHSSTDPSYSQKAYPFPWYIVKYSVKHDSIAHADLIHIYFVNQFKQTITVSDQILSQYAFSLEQHILNEVNDEIERNPVCFLELGILEEIPQWNPDWPPTSGMLKQYRIKDEYRILNKNKPHGKAAWFDDEPVDLSGGEILIVEHKQSGKSHWIDWVQAQAYKYNNMPALVSSGIGNEVSRTMEKLFPALKEWAHCPDAKCKSPNTYDGSLEDVIIHLNDFHMWTRESVADWLESLDLDIELKGEK